MLNRARGLGHGAPHHLERGGEEEGVAHRVFLEQVEGLLRLEAAAVAEDGLPVEERRHERVPQAARPRPVGRGPEEIARLRKAVVRELEAREVSDEGRLRHEGALGRTRRAARVDDDGGVLRPRLHAGEAGRGALEQALPRVDAGFARARHADHVRQRGEALAHGPQAGEGVGIDDRDLRAAVREPVLERVGPEQEGERHRDRAHLEAGEVGDDRLRALGKDDRHAVAAGHAEGRERIREAVGGLQEVPVGEPGRGARLVFPAQGEAAGSPAQRRQADSAMLQRAGTCQRNARTACA